MMYREEVIEALALLRAKLGEAENLIEVSCRYHALYFNESPAIHSLVLTLKKQIEVATELAEIVDRSFRNGTVT